MSYWLGVIIFVVALLVSVMLHEAGHFATAKAFGVKATQFFVGFGPTLWSTQRGDTEYGVKALPLGGYVKITGMTSMDEVDPEDEPRAFRGKPGWQRAIVLAAGSFMHFVIAFVLLWVVAIGIGQPSHSGTAVTVASCVPAAKGASCAASDPRSPASKAGLRNGDQIVSIAGKPVSNWNQIAAALTAQQPGKPVDIAIARDGKIIHKTIALAPVKWRKGSYLGVAEVPAYITVGPVAAVGQAGSQFGDIVTRSVTAFGQIPKAIPYLFAKNRINTPGGQIGSVVGAGNVAGQVIADGITWRDKVGGILLEVAALNIFVGVLNLLPLLPLDGGHLAVVAYERARAGIARMRRRADPGPVDYTRLIPVSVSVFALVVAFSVLLIVADLINPVNLAG